MTGGGYRIGAPRGPAPLAAVTSDNLSLAVANNAAAIPTLPALIGADLALDYATLEHAVRRCARDLRGRGIAPGTRVTLLFSDEVLLAITLLAVGRLGASAMVIPRSTPPAQARTWAARAGASHSVTDLAAPAITDLATCRLGRSWLAEALSSHNTGGPAVTAEGRPAAPLMIVVGSGSTGQPKLIPITHAQMRARALALASSYDVGPGGRLASTIHLEYAGAAHRLLCALTAGAAFVLPDRSARGLIDMRRRFGVTLLSASVFHIEQMLKGVPAGAPRPLDGMILTASSSIVSDRLRREVLGRLCDDFRISYGANETWNATVTGPGECLVHEGTVGRVVPGVEVQVVDAAMLPVAPGSVGLIRIRSDLVVDGYLDDDEATQRAFQDGWFMPGDLGRMTEDGHLIFCGRADDMMVFNGINIYPLEIEQCLLAHPAVADAVAFPLRHRVHQDVPACVVTLAAPGATDERTLAAHAAARLGARQPRLLVIADAIPRNAQGKPVRADLGRLVEHALRYRGVAPAAPRPARGGNGTGAER